MCTASYLLKALSISKEDTVTMTLWSALRCHSSSLGRVASSTSTTMTTTVHQKQLQQLPSYVAGVNRHKMMMSSVAEKDNILPVSSHSNFYFLLTWDDSNVIVDIFDQPSIYDKNLHDF